MNWIKRKLEAIRVSIKHEFNRMNVLKTEYDQAEDKKKFLTNRIFDYDGKGFGDMQGNKERQWCIVELRRLEALEALTRQTKSETPVPASNDPKITDPVIRRFCELINDSGIDPKGTLGAIPFCKRVCIKYNLPYSDNVRQRFVPNNKPVKSDKELKIVIAAILPSIPETDRKKIETYLSGYRDIYA